MMNIKNIFNNIKEILSRNVPELGKIMTHWEDPFSVNKNQTVFLPDRSSVAEQKAYFTIRVIISVVEKSADIISYSQMELVRKINSIIFSELFPYTVMGKDENYFDPLPLSPLVGVIDMSIDLIIDYLDGCD